MRAARPELRPRPQLRPYYRNAQSLEHLPIASSLALALLL